MHLAGSRSGLHHEPAPQFTMAQLGPPASRGVMGPTQRPPPHQPPVTVRNPGVTMPEALDAHTAGTVHTVARAALALMGVCAM